MRVDRRPVLSPAHVERDCHCAGSGKVCIRVAFRIERAPVEQ
jgi:hypothetical protein